MGYCLAQYYLTVNGGNGNENFWPPASNLALYPTYLCFVVGTLSAIFSLAVLAGYCWGTDTADRWDDRRGWLTKAGCVIKIILSAVVAINMKVTSNTDSPYSLWSVVCDTTSQKKFLGLINFNRGCSFQVPRTLGLDTDIGVLDGIICAEYRLHRIGSSDWIDICIGLVGQEAQRKNGKAQVDNSGH